jgi:hypothetical protein
MCSSWFSQRDGKQATGTPNSHFSAIFVWILGAADFRSGHKCEGYAAKPRISLCTKAAKGGQIVKRETLSKNGGA